MSPRFGRRCGHWNYSSSQIVEFNAESDLPAIVLRTLVFVRRAAHRAAAPLVEITVDLAEALGLFDDQDDSCDEFDGLAQPRHDRRRPVHIRLAQCVAELGEDSAITLEAFGVPHGCTAKVAPALMLALASCPPSGTVLLSGFAVSLKTFLIGTSGLFAASACSALAQRHGEAIPEIYAMNSLVVTALMASGATHTLVALFSSLSGGAPTSAAVGALYLADVIASPALLLILGQLAGRRSGEMVEPASCAAAAALLAAAAPLVPNPEVVFALSAAFTAAVGVQLRNLPAEAAQISATCEARSRVLRDFYVFSASVQMLCEGFWLVGMVSPESQIWAHALLDVLSRCGLCHALLASRRAAAQAAHYVAQKPAAPCVFSCHLTHDSTAFEEVASNSSEPRGGRQGVSSNFPARHRTDKKKDEEVDEHGHAEEEEDNVCGGDAGGGLYLSGLHPGAAEPAVVDLDTHHAVVNLAGGGSQIDYSAFPENHAGLLGSKRRRVTCSTSAAVASTAQKGQGDSGMQGAKLQPDNSTDHSVSLDVLPHDRNLPGFTSLEIPMGEMELVRADPGDGRYYTLAAMVKISEGKYTKEEAEKYWNEECKIPARDEPPVPSEHDWFSKLFGFSEASYVDAKRWLQVVPSKRGVGQQLNSKKNGASFAVGSFATPRLDALRGRAAVVSLPGKLKVTNELGDVAEKHSYDENRHATFQVASQFNCLEFVHPNVTPEDGVTGYAQDRTQGPACSLACGPATVFRNYFARMAVERGGRPEQYGQTLECMIDNLSDVSEVVGNVGETMYRVQGGYTQSDESKLKVLNASLAQLEKDDRIDEVRAALRIGVHDDVQVTSTAWGQNLLGRPLQTVTQVFGSACAVAYNAQTQPQSWERFASLVLEASYEATLCVALLAAQRHPSEPSSRRVFLTSLGGGVFGNPMEWVVAAMRRACERYKDYDLDVRVVTYAGEVHPLLQQLENHF